MAMLRSRKVEREVRVRVRRAGVRKSLRRARMEVVVRVWEERWSWEDFGNDGCCDGGAAAVVAGVGSESRYQIMEVA